MLKLSQHITPLTFEQFMQLPGKVYRSLENRRTVEVVLEGQTYFIKQHYGIGWKEIFKNILQLRLPVLSAKNEWLALKKLNQLGIHVPEIVGFGCRGMNPATRQSFIITKALPEHKSLEELSHEGKINANVKQTLIKKISQITKIMHDNGINHRDLYICHFLLLANHNNYDQLFLIDLHRAQIRKKIPTRWLLKDLAALYFSIQNLGFTTRDYLRFIREYRKTSLRDIFNKEAAFWLKVKKRGNKLYQKHTR